MVDQGGGGIKQRLIHPLRSVLSLRQAWLRPPRRGQNRLCFAVGSLHCAFASFRAPTTPPTSPGHSFRLKSWRPGSVPASPRRRWSLWPLRNRTALGCLSAFVGGGTGHRQDGFHHLAGNLPSLGWGSRRPRADGVAGHRHSSPDPSFRWPASRVPLSAGRFSYPLARWSNLAGRWVIRRVIGNVGFARRTDNVSDPLRDA